MKNELRITIPIKLGELSANQLKYIALLYLQEYPKDEFLLKALLKITGLKLLKEVKDEPGAWWFRHKSVKRPFILYADQLAEMNKKVDFLLNPDEVHPLRWIGLAKARHFRLYNATFEEYLMSENYYFAYVQTKDEQHLDNLIACLYRAPWKRWDAEKIQSRAKRFSRVRPEMKYTVFLWYIGFRAYVPKRCKALFSGKKSTRPFNVREYINGMIHQLNNGDITLKPVLLRRPVWDALDELEQRAIEADLYTPKN